MPQLASSLSEKNLATADRSTRCRLSSLLSSVLFVALTCCALLPGCRSAPVWSGEAKSPDGKAIATASTSQERGFLSGGAQTTVYLNWPVGSQTRTLILAYSDGPTAEDMAVEMKWLTPTHLELSYSGHRSLDFQAVKCNGIDITTRNVSSAASSTSAMR
jgi:hypothetical protein